MGHVVDLTAYLETAQPKIKIGEKEYTVNDEKSIVLRVQQILTAETEDGDRYTEIEKAFELLIGKEALKEIKEDHPKVFESTSKILVMVNGVMAAIQGQTYEEATQERFR